MKTKNISIKNIIPYLGLILVYIVFAVLTQGKLIERNNLKTILEQSILTITAGTGVIYVLAIGGLDLSQGSLLGIGSIVIASLSKINVWLAVIAAVVVCAGIGCVNGVLNAKAKMQSFIVTICIMYIFRGITGYITSSGAIAVSPEIYALNKLPFKMTIVIILLVLSYFLFNYTEFGDKIKSVGSGEIASWYSGINVNRIKILAFIIAGVTAGFASFMNELRTGTATASTGSCFETDVLLALVIGGMPVSGGSKSRFSSIIIGAFIVAALGNGLVILGVGPEYQQLVRGLVFLGAVAVSVSRDPGIILK